jgi:hypothetical protein
LRYEVKPAAEMKYLALQSNPMAVLKLKQVALCCTLTGAVELASSAFHAIIYFVLRVKEWRSSLNLQDVNPSRITLFWNVLELTRGRTFPKYEDRSLEIWSYNYMRKTPST